MKFKSKFKHFNLRKSIYLKMSSAKSRPFCLGLSILIDTYKLRRPCVLRMNGICIQGWGLLSHFPPFRYFPNFSSLSKHTLAVRYRVYIWQVSPQLSCGDTCQIWMWFKESNMYFYKIENFAYEEINERSFSNPHLRYTTHRPLADIMITSLPLWICMIICTSNSCTFLWNSTGTDATNLESQHWFT